MMVAMAGKLSVMAGSMICRNAAPKVDHCPCRRLSIRYNPVMVDGGSPDRRPLTGNQPSRSAKNNWNRMASQNAGKLTPSRATRRDI